MTFTNSHENAVMNASLGASATLIGSPIEIALSTTNPGEDGSGITEPVGFDYARVSIPNDGSQWDPTTTGQKINKADITFPEANGGSWGLISHWAIYRSGVIKFYGIIDDGVGSPLPVQIDDGDQFRFLAGSLRIILD